MFLVVSDGTGWGSEEEALGARGPVQVFIQGTGRGLSLPWDRKGDEAFLREGQSLCKDLRFGLNARPSFSQCFSNSLTLCCCWELPRPWLGEQKGKAQRKRGSGKSKLLLYLNRERFLGLRGVRGFSVLAN